MDTLPADAADAATEPLAAAAAAPAGNGLLTHNTDGKTVVDADGHLRGLPHAGRRAFNIELVRAMMDVRGLDLPIRDVPFKRGFAQVQSGHAPGIFSVVRNAQREGSVAWVGPLQVNNGYFFEMAGRPTGVASLEEAKTVAVIAVVDGTVTDDFLTARGFTNLVRVNSYKACYGMLRMGRAQLAPATEQAVGERLALVGLTRADVQALPFVLFTVDGYLALAPETPADEVAAWQAALDRLKADGSYERLQRDFYLPAPGLPGSGASP